VRVRKELKEGADRLGVNMREAVEGALERWWFEKRRQKE
jgi:hypothetical protein